MKILLVFIFQLALLPVIAQKAPDETQPGWIKDLVIYEIATKGFTSPAGPESGNFKSLTEKLDHLQKLGVNCIWLSGNNWADDKHFYGIWTQYATIRPDSIDASLGTREEFRQFIAGAHTRGIKVFLDVITHGVLNSSPFITEHPEWFKGGSWGMSDYDWKGNHPDLEDWWVKTWTDYVLKDGIDGYRLDVIIYRPDLWQRIRENCAKGGHPIAVFDESLEPFSPEAFDFYQYYMKWYKHEPGKTDTGAIYYNDLASFYKIDTNATGSYYSTQLSCHDNGWIGFPPNVNPYTAKGSRYVLGYGGFMAPSIPIMMSGEEFNADYKPLPGLSPDLYGKRAPNDSSRWLYGGWLQWKDLENPDKKSVLNDVTKLIRIRTQEKDVIHAFKTSSEKKNILPVKNFTQKELPVPYIVYNDKKIILVAANPSTGAVKLDLNIPLREAGFTQPEFRITDLWNNKQAMVVDAGKLEHLQVEIKPDHTPGGGIAIYKIEAY